MKLTLTTLAMTALLAAPTFAAGDAEAGKKVFNQCQTCHAVVAPDGTVLAGKNAKTGPNLYGIVNRVAGSYPDFKYGESIVAMGVAGYKWTEADLATYVQDPAAFLEATLGDDSAKSKMMFKVKKEEDAANVAAFLASISPATP